MEVQFSVLFFKPPGRATTPIGVILFDYNNQQFSVRLREDWEAIADPDDAEVLSGLCGHLTRLARELGGAKLLEYLENTCSLSVQISDRQGIQTTTSLEDALDDL